MINYLAVLVSAIASMVIGSIWYGPLFGKMFIRESGMEAWTPEKKEAMKKKMRVSYALQLIASLIMFTVLDAYIVITGRYGIEGGLLNALLIWIGFIVPLAFGNTLWGGKMSLFWLSIGNMFFTLMAAGAILGAWR